LLAFCLGFLLWLYGSQQIDFLAKYKHHLPLDSSRSIETIVLLLTIVGVDNTFLSGVEVANAGATSGERSRSMGEDSADSGRQSEAANVYWLKALEAEAE